MTDIEVYMQFANLMGYKPDIQQVGEISIVAYGTDCDANNGTSKRNTFSYGYDAIDFLGLFDKHGGLIRAYNISHVALPKAPWAERFLQDLEAAAQAEETAG